MDITQYIEYLEGDTPEQRTVDILDMLGNKYLQRLKAQAPVKTGKYASSYKKLPVKQSGDTYEMTIYNDVPYGVPIEAGVVPGEKPWPSTKSGGVALQDGRIWSKKAIGGVIRPLLRDPAVEAELIRASLRILVSKVVPRRGLRDVRRL